MNLSAAEENIATNYKENQMKKAQKSQEFVRTIRELKLSLLICFHFSKNKNVQTDVFHIYLRKTCGED